MNAIHDFLFQTVYIPGWLYWLYQWLLLLAGAIISIVFLIQGGNGIGVIGGLLLGYGVVIKLKRTHIL